MQSRLAIKDIMTTPQLHLRPVACGVCDADDWQLCATGQDYEYHTSEDLFQMVECNLCGNIYLNPRPNTDDLSQIYPENYYSYNYETAVHPIARRAKDFLDQMKIKNWMKHISTAQPWFLDVGCGDGRYLKMLNSVGIPKEQLYGVEMSHESVNGLKNEGYESFYGRIEDVSPDLPKEGFDLIVLLQVIEHVESPKAVIHSFAGLLRKGGVLLIETPNTKSLDVSLFRKSYWGGYHFPRHWNLFNKSTLSQLVEEQGLSVKKISFLPAHSFWIFSCHHLIANRWGMARLARFFNPLRNLALLGLFTAFDMVRAMLGFQTSNIQIVAVKP